MSHMLHFRLRTSKKNGQGSASYLQEFGMLAEAILTLDFGLNTLGSEATAIQST